MPNTFTNDHIDDDRDDLFFYILKKRRTRGNSLEFISCVIKFKKNKLIIIKAIVQETNKQQEDEITNDEKKTMSFFLCGFLNTNIVYMLLTTYFSFLIL